MGTCRSNFLFIYFFFPKGAENHTTGAGAGPELHPEMGLKPPKVALHWKLELSHLHKLFPAFSASPAP